MYKYVFGLLFLSACVNTGSELVELDLLDNGIPIKILAPAGAKVEVSGLGMIKDIIIRDTLNYFVQIFASKANSLNPKKVKNDYKKIIEDSRFFSKITEDYEHGFIYEKKIDENIFRYDFRYIRIQGDQQYIFQTGLGGGYDESMVRIMYQAVQ